MMAIALPIVGVVTLSFSITIFLRNGKCKNIADQHGDSQDNNQQLDLSEAYQYKTSHKLDYIHLIIN